MSLFLSSLSPSSTESSIRQRVLETLPKMDPALVRSIVHVAKTRCVFLHSFFPHLPPHGDLRCAFVNFKERGCAERAAEAWANGLDVDGERVTVKWGRSRVARPPDSSGTPVIASS